MRPNTYGSGRIRNTGWMTNLLFYGTGAPLALARLALRLLVRLLLAGLELLVRHRALLVLNTNRKKDGKSNKISTGTVINI